MAFCQKCGSRLNEGSAFCGSCGTRQGEDSVQRADRMITIERKGAFGTDPMGVYIDDGEYAILRFGETKTFPIPSGMHRLQIRTTSHAIGKGGLTVGQGNKNSYSSDVIYIKESDGDLTFSVTMNMFGKITIKSR